MPNLLAHFGAQGPLTHAVLRDIDSRWVLAACIVPDVPWILQRAARVFAAGIDAYSLRLYVVVQGSLLFALVLSAALSLLSSHPRKVFTVLAIGCVLHLLLDSLETKWGNGVHFVAPLSWEMLNFRLFWPESALTYALTIAGVLYAGWAWMRRGRLGATRLCNIAVWKGAAACGFAALYLALPLALLEGPWERDNHYVRTLREYSERPGRYVEFDRSVYQAGDTADLLTTFTGEQLIVGGGSHGLSGLVSVRAVFVDSSTLHIEELHRHSAWWARDMASYAGLVLLLAITLGSLHTRRGLPYADRAASRDE